MSVGVPTSVTQARTSGHGIDRLRGGMDDVLSTGVVGSLHRAGAEYEGRRLGQERTLAGRGGGIFSKPPPNIPTNRPRRRGHPPDSASSTVVTPPGASHARLKHAAPP